MAFQQTLFNSHFLTASPTPLLTSPPIHLHPATSLKTYHIEPFSLLSTPTFPFSWCPMSTSTPSNELSFSPATIFSVRLSCIKTSVIHIIKNPATQMSAIPPLRKPLRNVRFVLSRVLSDNLQCLHQWRGREVLPRKRRKSPKNRSWNTK